MPTMLRATTISRIASGSNASFWNMFCVAAGSANSVRFGKLRSPMIRERIRFRRSAPAGTRVTE